MKVRLHPGDETAVGKYRVVYPGEVVRTLGAEVEEHKGFEWHGRLQQTPRGWEPRKTPVKFEADVIILQRPSLPAIVDLIPVFQERGHAIVVDVDDDIHAVHHRNYAKGRENPQNVLRACARADLVTVSTPQLVERYAPHGRVAVLPNCVPERLLDMPRLSDGKTVGWSGWVGVHPGDLRTVGIGVQQALTDTGARFRQIGPGDGVRLGLSLDEEPEATGGLGMDEYYMQLGSLDVGICPLEDSKFNRSKSRLKVLEMAARGAAVVASPRPDYIRMANEWLCILAQDRSRSWRTQVKSLLRDEGSRADIVGCGWQTIREHHTYETQGHLWAEAWEQAIRNHRRSTSVRSAA